VDSAEFSSGDLARATGNTVRTIRFYEEQGLLRPSVVSEGGHRRYTVQDLEKLRLIADLRELGLPLSEIRAVLDLRAGCTTAAEFAVRFEQVLVAHVEQAQRRLDRLRRVKRELTEALSAIQSRLTCHDTERCPCAVGDTLGSMRIVKVLASNGLCQHEAVLEQDHVTTPSGPPKDAPKS
jgi:MerR family Zn(II)-responsive transcriptional regulator of zntA